MGALLTSGEAADLLHLHVKRVQALARAGRLPAVRIGRKWLFPRQALMAALDSRPGHRLTGEVEISARNQLLGRVVGVLLGDVMAEVRVEMGGQELVSIITRASAERLGIRVGDQVRAVIKATEVMIGKP